MKAIFFDFDGTLTYTSLNFWKKIWASLGYDIKEGSYYKTLFNDAINGKYTHQEWCDLVCEKFIEAGLTKEFLEDIANTIDLIDGVEETLIKLKEEGYLLFIVSGNIKQVIEYILQEKQEYFDRIFANNFIFDESGKLVNILGTKYDNKGKADIVNIISEAADIKKEDIWFVGNGGNDEWVYTTGCKTILINPYDTTKKDDKTVWHKQLSNVTNLLDILPIINQEE